MKSWNYPFSALVRQEALKAALLLNAIDVSIGGVLIRGQKGTGKTTAARAFSRLLPEIETLEGCPYNSDPAHPVLPSGTPTTDIPPLEPVKIVRRATPFVELPLNATEDRLAGALHLEKALQTGRRHFDPGLLAAANRGILYVDEVNLLDDHLVDLLLDAAASGVNIVEREGLSFTHPAKFMLIGTMNPEEGELRPQFLDRFGLCATAASITDLKARETIVRRRLAFDHDPAEFVRQWEGEDRLLAEQIRAARSRLADVAIPEAVISLVARLGHELGVSGHRADIVLIKAARAHAAFMEKQTIELEDVEAVTTLAVSHRMPASPLDTPESLRHRIDQVFRKLTGASDPPESGDADGSLDDLPEAPESFEEMAETMQVPGVCAAGSVMLSFLKKKTANRSLTPTRG